MTLNPKLQTKAQDYKIADIGLAMNGVNFGNNNSGSGFLSFCEAMHNLCLHLISRNYSDYT